jgi:hypothetical protein
MHTPIRLLPCILSLAGALPAFGQSYETVVANARNGQGYEPAAIVAGWERDESFSVIAIARDGQRKDASGVALDWKASLTTGPRGRADDDDVEDERYLPPDLKARDATPRKTRKGQPEPFRVITWSSTTCPALLARMAALAPLTNFVFDPPMLKGEPRPPGDGREGFDLWIRAGAAELKKSSELRGSPQGAWFAETVSALGDCPPTSTQVR